MSGHRARRTKASWGREYDSFVAEWIEAFAELRPWLRLWGLGIRLATQSVIDEWRPPQGRHRRVVSESDLARLEHLVTPFEDTPEMHRLESIL